MWSLEENVKVNKKETDKFVNLNWNKRLTEDISDFHDKFGLSPGSSEPKFLPIEVMDFRIKFLYEELSELERAYADFDLAGALDALVDLVYVALGTSHMMALPFEEAWDLVQAANMKKIRVKRSEDSKRGSIFDVMKPEGWEPPDLESLLAKKLSKFKKS